MRYKRVLNKQERNRYIAFLEGFLDAVEELEMGILPIERKSTTCVSFSAPSAVVVG